MKYQKGGKIMTEFVRLRPKSYSCIIDDGGGDKELKEQRSV